MTGSRFDRKDILRCLLNYQRGLEQDRALKKQWSDPDALSNGKISPGSYSVQMERTASNLLLNYVSGLFAVLKKN